MFKKILIANRGEIACRIIKTLKDMKISSVAVYSKIDNKSMHVVMADEAILIGGALPKDSYLSIKNIINAVKKSGAEAVHPGYGFLSESYEFAKQLEKEGITLIGPNADTISLMGDKIKSKNTAIKAGLEVIQGSDKAISTLIEAKELTESVGFPIMLKAAAGGGGKGMRIVNNFNDLKTAFQQAQNEAFSSFNDRRVFIEKYIDSPHHIEVQILGDKFGNIVHLGERDCSIQRRHQKVIEESPSPFLDNQIREQMVQKAITLAQAVNYFSAGTVEFLVDKRSNFYFLEMNTRIQVEHPVSEKVFGVDLIKLMINVAAGKSLLIKQTDLVATGHAIEARIYAEDPQEGFLPSTGRLTDFSLLSRTDKIRLDSGVREGSNISVYYDPMLAKLISYGSNRKQAIQTLSSTLEKFYVRGVKNNILFLIAVLNTKTFKNGTITTDFIETEWPNGFVPSGLKKSAVKALVAISTYVHRLYETREYNITEKKRPADPELDHWHVMIAGNDYHSIVSENNQKTSIDIENISFSIKTDWQIGDPCFSGYLNKKRFFIQIDKHFNIYWLRYKASLIKVTILNSLISPLSTVDAKKK